MKRLLAAVVAVWTFTGCAAPPLPPIQTTQLTVNQAIKVAFVAGFTTETTLLPVVAIAVAESSLYPTARNYHPEYGTSDRGLWQISGYFHPEYSDDICDRPELAVQAVKTLSSDGTDWSPWDVFVDGSAQAHYDRAFDGWPALRPVVRQYLANPT